MAKSLGGTLIVFLVSWQSRTKGRTGLCWGEGLLPPLCKKGVSKETDIELVALNGLSFSRCVKSPPKNQQEGVQLSL